MYANLQLTDKLLTRILIRPLILALGLAAILLCSGTRADAALWPLRDVAVTLPFSAENEADLLLTAQQESFRASTGYRLLPRYVPGRGGEDAWANMDFGLANGDALTAIELPGLVLRSLRPGNMLRPADMALCHLGAYSPLALWVPKDSALGSLEDFIAAAGRNPGMQVAGPGSFSPAQLAALRFDRLAGIRTVFMPQLGSVEAARAAQDGKIAAFWAAALTFPELTANYRPLAVAADSRSAAFPELPTFSECGYDLVEGSLYGYALPAATPLPIRLAVFESFEALRGDPAFREAARALGFSLPEVPLAALLTGRDRTEAAALALTLPPPEQAGQWAGQGTRGDLAAAPPDSDAPVNLEALCPLLQKMFPEYRVKAEELNLELL